MVFDMSSIRTTITIASLLLLSPSVSLAEPPLLDKPLGIGVTTFSIEQALTANSLGVSIAGQDLSALKDQISIDNEVTVTGVTLDYWIKPYLNIAAKVGNIEGETTLDTSTINPAALPITLPPLSIKYSGLAYNVSATFALGYENLFSTLTYSYSRTDLDNNSTVSADIIVPTIGVKTQYGAFRLGAISIDSEENHTGSYDLPGIGHVPYDVSLETDDKFNYFLGYSHTFKNNIQAIAEAGIGGKDLYSLSVIKRF